MCDVHHAVRTPSAPYYARSCQATCCTQEHLTAWLHVRSGGPGGAGDPALIKPSAMGGGGWGELGARPGVWSRAHTTLCWATGRTTAAHEDPPPGHLEKDEAQGLLDPSTQIVRILSLPGTNDLPYPPHLWSLSPKCCMFLWGGKIPSEKASFPTSGFINKQLAVLGRYFYRL